MLEMVMYILLTISTPVFVLLFLSRKAEIERCNYDNSWYDHKNYQSKDSFNYNDEPEK